MSKLYRKHVREQEVYCGKPAEDFFAAAGEEKTQEPYPCEKCLNIQDLSLWCNECLKRELDTQEAYYSGVEF